MTEKTKKEIHFDFIFCMKHGRFLRISTFMMTILKSIDNFTLVVPFFLFSFCSYSFQEKKQISLANERSFQLYYNTIINVFSSSTLTMKIV